MSTILETAYLITHPSPEHMFAESRRDINSRCHEVHILYTRAQGTYSNLTIIVTWLTDIATTLLQVLIGWLSHPHCLHDLAEVLVGRSHTCLDSTSRKLSMVETGDLCIQSIERYGLDSAAEIGRQVSPVGTLRLLC